MHTLTRALAAAAALALIAAPAYAQRINTGATGAYGQTQLRAGFEPDPFSVSVLGGGAIDSTSVNAECNAGYLPQRASYTLRYTANTAEYPTLYIGAFSDADTTIAVRGPNNQWICNDDANGLNPMVSIDSPRSGRYQIFVGRFGAQNETAQATLYVSETGASGVVGDAGGGASPDWSLEPAYGTLELAAGFMPDPHQIAIAAGGDIDASSVGCVGWVAAAPDYRVNWTAGSTGLPLIFSAQSNADTVLLVNDAEGNWLCNDDTNGVNPAISITTPASGQYDVWVGTYMRGDLQDSTLSISEMSSGE